MLPHDPTFFHENWLWGIAALLCWPHLSSPRLDAVKLAEANSAPSVPMCAPLRALITCGLAVWMFGLLAPLFRGSHLSNTTCLTQVLFKSGQSSIQQSVMILDTTKHAYTDEAVLNQTTPCHTIWYHAIPHHLGGVSGRAAAGWLGRRPRNHCYVTVCYCRVCIVCCIVVYFLSLSLYIYIYMYIHICIYVYMYIVHIYIYIERERDMYRYTYYTHNYADMCIYIYIYMYTHMNCHYTTLYYLTLWRTQASSSGTTATSGSGGRL